MLEVALHTNGGTLAFNGYTHEQFVDLFHAIGSDSDNRVVILTGSGDAFMETISPEGFDFFTPRGYDKIYREGRKVLMNILDIEVPLIAAVNGPMRLHTEYILLADIVLATPSTVFQDKPHFELGVASGDGVHLLWQEAIGTIRGRYFILTRQELDAQTAKEWGAVNEIVPADKLLPRSGPGAPAGAVASWSGVRLGAELVKLDAQRDQVLDRGGVDVAGDHRDDHRVAGHLPGGVAVQPGAAVPGADRVGGAVGGPPGPVLGDPLVLQDPVLVVRAARRSRCGPAP